ncbi:MAG TPA: extracellular solute-binding protein [Bradyrhizobium sp.]|nr:extracellular solute-binding protein [Bradyrhizobium sp.]
MASMQGLTLLFALLLVLLLAFLFTLLGSCVQSLSASAQTAQPAAADLAAYGGADRMEKLVAAAKKEGSVVVYSSAAMDDMAALIAAFEKKYGVKVRLWRASSENIVQRAVVEARGGRFDADVFETGATAMESMQRERLFQEIKTPALSALLPAAILPHREWIGTRFNIFVAAYNTGLIKDGLPKRYDDLLDRRWADKLGVEAEDSDWFGAVVSALGEDKGLKLFRDIVAANGISVRKGHTLLANLVVTGEVPLALTAYAYKAEQLRKSGAPIGWFVIPPGVARFEGAGVARRASHPNAAILFFEFMLTDGQDILLARDFFPARANARSLPEGALLHFLDPAKGLDEYAKWSKQYRDVVTNPTH